MNKTWFDKLTKRRENLSGQLKDPAAIGFWNMVVDKYSDKAHFIYELLQNADDAHASYVRIKLYNDHLEFIHNGNIHFSISDPDCEDEKSNLGHLNAITSIGSSSKQKGNAIGKFGIGFKSVFQYSSCPHIEDDEVSFKIEDYIVPKYDKIFLSDRKNGETLFYLPFNQKETAYSDILHKLSTLHKPLLFLPHVKKITWSASDNHNGIYERNTLDRQTSGLLDYEFLCLYESINENEKKYFFHFFTRKEIQKNEKISVAFFSDSNGCLEKENHEESAFCFFSTNEETRLNQLLHAPFLLTDNRENIKSDDSWNLYLVDELAKLTLDSLEFLCDSRKLLNDNNSADDGIFSVIPLDKNLFYRKEKNVWVQKSLFAPFYDYFSTELKTRKVFLTDANTYVDGFHVRFASDKKIVKLFPQTKMSELEDSESETGAFWCFNFLYALNDAQQRKLIEDYLFSAGLIASYWTPEKVISQLTDTFLHKQSLDWLKNLYQFLASRRELFTSQSVLRTTPIVLCSDDKFRAPYTNQQDVIPSIYFSPGNENHFVSVHPALKAEPSCMRFFEMLGLKEPDVLAETLQLIIPQYQENKIFVFEKETLYRHLNIFMTCFYGLSPFSAEKTAFIQLLSDVAFLPVQDESGSVSLQKPNQCFVENALLKDFLEGCPNVYFINNAVIKEGISVDKRNDFYEFLSALGVHFGLQVKTVKRESSKSVLESLRLTPKSIRQYDNGAQIIEDREIVGFDYFSSHLTPQRSQAFFELLRDEINKQSSFLFQLLLEGKYQYIEKGKHSYTEEKILYTSARSSLFDVPWLYNKQNQLKSPKNIENTSELSDIYDLSSNDLFFFLGITLSAEITGLTEKQRKAISIVSKFETNGISIDQMEVILRTILKSRENG